VRSIFLLLICCLIPWFNFKQTTRPKFGKLRVSFCWELHSSAHIAFTIANGCTYTRPRCSSCQTYAICSNFFPKKLIASCFCQIGNTNMANSLNWFRMILLLVFYGKLVMVNGPKSLLLIVHRSGKQILPGLIIFTTCILLLDNAYRNVWIELKCYFSPSRFSPFICFSCINNYSMLAKSFCFGVFFFFTQCFHSCHMFSWHLLLYDIVFC
jgi:hypothetical protein